MKLKEGIDYNIKPVGKYFELTSITLPGFVAGIVDLTRRGYEINLNTTNFIGSLLMAKTIPKPPKPQKNPASKKAVDKKSPEKVVVEKE